jgi:hypothetical protein
MTRTEYRKTIEENTATAERLARTMHLLGTVRLLLVGGLVALWVIFGDRDWAFLATGSALLIVPFVWLMARHENLSHKRDYVETMRLLCENELKGLDGCFEAFDGATDKIDASHPFTLDLDIFGDRSLMRSLNRTVTVQGRERLADWFAEPLTDKAKILERQQAVKELAAKTSLRQQFYVTGALRKKNGEATIIGEAAGAKKSWSFGGIAFWRAMTWIVPAVWIALFALFAAGVLNAAILGLAFVVSFAIANCKLKQINKIHNATDRTSAALETYSRLVEITEGANLSSKLYKSIHSHLLSGNADNTSNTGNSGSISCPDNLPASRAIKQLSTRLGALDQRANMLIATLNIFVLWDIRSAIAVADWHEKYSHDIEKWFDALGEFDALCSLAGFASNHPDYTYPEIVDGYFTLSGRALGHPLMKPDECVRNDIEIDRHPSFMIVTGANMAGKSTFLRTVGVNCVLASVGVPVCAESLKISICNLATSLRTSDSLADGESYFFAELKRLKMIIERLKSGERLFIILDEILKGTNSVDKQRGSLALVRQLVSLDTCGIIATHDLALGGLHDEFPKQVSNYRFEADIIADRLSFTYKLRPGIAENMNATFLMQKMGITL